MPIIFAAGYIIIRLAIEAYQRHKADQYALNHMRHY